MEKGDHNGLEASAYRSEHLERRRVREGPGRAAMSPEVGRLLKAEDVHLTIGYVQPAVCDREILDAAAGRGRPQGQAALGTTRAAGAAARVEGVNGPLIGRREDHATGDHRRRLGR